MANLRDFVEQLLGVFRSNDGAAVQHIINTIRAGASLEEIRAAVLQVHSQTSGRSNPHQMDPSMMNDHMSNFFDSQ